MSEINNEQFNDQERILKKIYQYPYGKQDFGFFGDNSNQTNLDYSPKKNLNKENKNSIITENSNLYSLKTMDNTEINFKRNNLKSFLPNEFKILSTESSKFNTLVLSNNNTNINFNNSNNKNDILFSGYFGKKYESKKINDDNFSKNTCSTINPFTNIIEEENDKITDKQRKVTFKTVEQNDFETSRDSSNKSDNFMQDSDKNFEDFLNYKNSDRNSNLSNDKPTNNDIQNCAVFKSTIYDNENKKDFENDNKKQFNNLVRSVTISSLNSNTNINNTFKSNINTTTNSFSNILFNNNFGFNQSCSFPKKKSIFLRNLKNL